MPKLKPPQVEVLRTTRGRLATIAQMARTVGASELEFLKEEKNWAPVMRPLTVGDAEADHVLGCSVFDEESKMLSCDEGGKIMLWQIQTGQLMATMEGHEKPVRTVSQLTYNGKSYALSCGDDGTFKIWDLESETFRCVHTQVAHAGKEVHDCRAVQFGPAGGWKILTCATDSLAKVWTFPAEFKEEGDAVPDETLKGHKGEVLCGALFVVKDTLMALTGAKDNLIKVWALKAATTPGKVSWDPKSELNGQLKGHDGLIYGLAVSDDGQRVLSASGDRMIKYWELAKFTCLRTLKDTAQVNSCAFFPRRVRSSSDVSVPLAVTCSNDSTTIWDLTSGEAVRKLYGHDSVMTCALFGEGTKLVTCGKAKMRVLDLSAITSCLDLDKEEHPMKTMWGKADTDGDGDLDPKEIGPVLHEMGRDVTPDMIESVRKELDKDGDGKIDAEEFADWYTKQPERKVRRAHGSVVKEIAMFPDAENSNVLSCSYDGSVKVWCLKTGDIRQTLEETHGKNIQVMEVVGFPDNRQIMTCGGDCTVKVWDWATGECTATLVGHTEGKNTVRGCGVFSCGKKAFSCSQNGEIKIWQLQIAPDETTVTGGKVIMNLEGHKALVDRCCLYDGDTRLISASWDKTLRVWDVSESGNGKEIYVLQDDNKTRGVAVFGGGKKAVSTGSGLTISIWDLETGKIERRIDTNHTATVWGVVCIDEVEVPQADGIPAKVPMAITFSGDGTTKMWSLESEHEHEIVAARRFLDPGPMCACVLPASYGLGMFPLLVGGFQSIKLVDMSNVGAGASGGALWACYSDKWQAGSAEFDAWKTWLLEAVKEDNPHFMYTRERGAEFPTLIHKLAKDPQGALLLNEILNVYKPARKAVLEGTPLKDQKMQDQGTATIGLISRAGMSATQGNAMVIATNYKNEDMASLLMEDYCQHIKCFEMKEERGASVTDVFDISERDLVVCFETFPQIAYKFLKDLPMRRTGLVSKIARCDFTDTPNETIINTTDMSVDDLDATKGTSFWGDYITARWEKSPLKNKATESVEDDSAWGVKVASYAHPIQAIKPVATEAGKKADTKGEYKALDDSQAVERDTLLGSGNSSSGDNESSTGDGNGLPPYSMLLKKALDYSDEKGDPDIFLSKTLQHIVQWKWEKQYRFQYNAMFIAYLVHITTLTWVMLCFQFWQFDVGASTEDMHLVEADVPHAQAKRISIWIGWGYVCFYNVAMVKHEVHQMRADGLWEYFTDIFNIIDIIGSCLSLYSLVAMLYVTGEETGSQQLFLDVIRAQAMMFSWFKVLYFLRGLEQTAFLVKLLVQIAVDIKFFLAVLVVILVAFAVAFYLLLRFNQKGEYDENFRTVPMSFVSVYDMTFGAFNIEWFRDTPSVAFIAICDFMIFMLLVPTIMLNALIALMADTFAKVKEKATQTNLKERASIIMEIEQAMVYRKGATDPRRSPISLVLRTLFAMHIEFGEFPRNLHLLMPQHAKDKEENSKTLMAMSEMNDTVRKMKNIEQKGQENIILLLHQLKELTAKVETLSAQVQTDTAKTASRAAIVRHTPYA